LLLLLVAGLTPPTVAQPPQGETTERPSHRTIDSPLSQSSNPERDLASRLSGTRASKERLDDLLRDKEIQKLAQSLLKDPKFLESMKSQLRPEQLKELRDRFQRGDSLDQLRRDPELQRLLRGSVTNPTLDNKQRELIQKWAEKNPPSPFPGPPNLPPRVPGSPPFPPPGPNPPGGMPRPSVPPPAPVPPPTSDTTPEWLRERLRTWNNHINKMIKSDPEGWRDFLKRLAENRQGGEKIVRGTLDSARGMGKMLPRMGNLVPRGVLPSALPRFGVPRLGGGSLPSAMTLGSVAQLLLFAVVGVVIVVLLWRSASWVQAYREASRAEWRLGPWPVAIAAIQTREQLVRAFEYLSLLLLGREARTRHHRALAAQLGQLPDLDPEARAEAARQLAERYARARYAPQGEPMSEAEFDQARRELRRLAGEAA
jgi:hypothetical protein